MKLPYASEAPKSEGVHACLTWHGWKILEWREGIWHFEGGHARWGGEVDACVWLAPLKKREPLPVRSIPAAPAALEFDL